MSGDKKQMLCPALRRGHGAAMLTQTCELLLRRHLVTSGSDPLVISASTKAVAAKLQDVLTGILLVRHEYRSLVAHFRTPDVCDTITGDPR